MKVHTVGSNIKMSRSELRLAVRFMCAQLMSRQMCDRLFIRVHSILDLRLGEEPCKAWMRAFQKEPNPPRRFNIYLNSRWGKRMQLIALGHELTHVRQYATEQLRDREGEKIVRFKRESFNQDRIPYFFQPWEIDAYGHEKGLYFTYLEYVNKQGIRFE